MLYHNFCSACAVTVVIFEHLIILFKRLKVLYIAVKGTVHHLTAMGRHLPYRITVLPAT